jgi:hypothetical protein
LASEKVRVDLVIVQEKTSPPLSSEVNAGVGSSINVVTTQHSLQWLHRVSSPAISPPIKNPTVIQNIEEEKGGANVK